MIVSGHCAVYKWGVSSGAHLNKKLNELLEWQAIRWRRDKGCHYYDLGGITPPVAEALKRGEERPPVRGTGIANFKHGFGQMVTFPESYDNNFGCRPRWLVRKTVDHAWRPLTLQKLARGVSNA